MSGPTLADELRRKAKDDSAAIWDGTKGAAERHRAKREKEIAQQSDRDSADLAAKTAEFERAATSDAERLARTTLAAAKSELAGRLRRIAAEVLPTFREADSARIFATLAAELPARAWKYVAVNPADEGVARTLFPQAQIATSPTITGGVEAAADEGRIRVINTLEARLENAWPDILPTLMRQVLTEVSHSQPAA